jgi:diguanylate cyclase (GGDEF)-like protein
MPSTRILLAKRLKLTTAALCVLVLSLATPLLVHQSRAYSLAENGDQSLNRFRATLLAMESVSAERGPANGALGADARNSPSLRLPLINARAESDRRLAVLRSLITSQACPGCTVERTSVDAVETQLVAARKQVDGLIAQPIEHRDHDAVLSAVNQMVAVIPNFGPAANASAAGVVRGDPNALNCILTARLTAQLREQAGLLGSTFTAALTAHRPLSETELFAQERAKGRIDELRGLIAARVEHTPISATTYERLTSVYYDNGLSYMVRVRAMAMRPGGAELTAAELAAEYVPTMRPIVQFRDFVLDLAETEVKGHRNASLMLLVASAIGTAGVLYLLLIASVYFKRRFVQPFIEAADIIMAIADGKLETPIPHGEHRLEIRSLFHAILVLKENSIEKMRLEHERNILLRELETVADTDFLTRLLNRRAFERKATASLSRRTSSEAKQVLIMFDADRFKQINDTLGHAAGDLALQTIGRLCSEIWHKPDIVARLGGEEFAVLTKVDDASEAVGAANELRRRLASTALELDGVRFTVTLSFGISLASQTGRETLDALLLRADKLLYSAKLGGRNCIVSDIESSTSH